MFLCCFLTSCIFLSVSCLSLQPDIARYTCTTKTATLLDNKTKSVKALMTEIWVNATHAGI